MRGEQINKRGAVQGGYHASSNSKLKAHKALNDSRQRVAELEEAAETAGAAVKQREQAVTRLRSTCGQHTASGTQWMQFVVCSAVGAVICSWRSSHLC